MKKLLICLGIIISCFSCVDVEKKALEEEEYKVITTIIEYQCQFYDKKVGAKQDTVKKYIFFSDSLWNVNLKKNATKRINGELTLKYSYNGEEDTIYYPLVVKLADSVETTEFLLPKIKSKCREYYVFEYDWNREFYPKDIIIKENISFSRVVFNTNKDRACIYVASVCGGECGGGVLYFLKKVDNKWIIETDKVDLLWVS